MVFSGSKAYLGFRSAVLKHVDPVAGLQGCVGSTCDSGLAASGLGLRV